jgi:hypothetical protein
MATAHANFDSALLQTIGWQEYLMKKSLLFARNFRP